MRLCGHVTALWEQAALELLEDDDFQRDADGGTFERIVDEVKANPAAAAKCVPAPASEGSYLLCNTPREGSGAVLGCRLGSLPVRPLLRVLSEGKSSRAESCNS